MTSEKHPTELLRSFLEVGLHLAEDLDIARVLDVVVRRARELTGSDHGVVATLAPDGTVDHAVRQHSGGAPASPSGQTSEKDALLDHIVRERRSVRIQNMAGDPALAAAGEGRDGAFLGVPLEHRGALVGALYLTKPSESPAYDDEDETLVTALGATAAVAIENARLLARETDRAERSALLKEIASKVRRSLDVSEVLTESVEILATTAGADRCYVRLVEAPGTLRLGPIEVEWDADGVPRLDPSVRNQFPVGTLSAQTRKTQWTDDVTTDPRYQDPALAESLAAMLRSGARAALSTPLEWGDELIGVVTLHSLAPRRWTEAERALIEAVGREVSVALHHARLYYEALDQAEKLQQLDTLRSDFLSMVSHELRSPMTVVSGIAHILRWRGESLAAETRDELLDTLERESRRLTRLVSEFLDLDAIERGHVILRPEKIDLADLAGEAMVDAGQSLRTSLHIEGQDMTVIADRDRIKQVLLNLLGNAAKFSEDATPIDLIVTAEPEHVTMAVRDRGAGIPAADIPRLFERFTRLSTTVQRTAGSGIGLYVSKHIVDLHGGEIAVESTPGEGATFSVRLPRNP